METCAYCGTEVNERYCSFCEMELTERYILQDGKRLKNSIDHYPDMQRIFLSTPELLELETIELLCLLKHAREYRAQVYKLRLLTHEAEAQGGSVEEIQMQSYSDYADATRKAWVIENIIKDRIGYYPQKITDNFLSMYLERIERSQKKRMVMQTSVKQD